MYVYIYTYVTYTYILKKVARHKKVIVNNH